jgi:GNAT superfamily N-acetyltransferase
MSHLTIHQFTSDDIPAASTILDLAFGPLTWPETLQRSLLLQPEGLLLAKRGGQTLGLIGGIDYGPFAYIGLLGVHPSVRRQGVARALMINLLAWLDECGCPLSLLDATPAGAPLYEQLGFVDVCTSAVVTCAQLPIPGPLPIGVERLAAPDLDTLVAFDAPIFGAERRTMLTHLSAASPERTLITRDESGAISGYLVAQTHILGPWIARTPAVAAQLIEAGLSCGFAAPPRVCVPGENPATIALLTDVGFVVQQELRHMQRGRRPRPGEGAALYGLTSFALG